MKANFLASEVLVEVLEQKKKKKLAEEHKVRGTKPHGWVHGSITSYLFTGLSYYSHKLLE